MKRTLLFMAAFVLMAMCANAQGTWKVAMNEATIAPSTEMGMGISNLQCMHSDAANITEKSDVGAPLVTYDDVTYDNEAMVQGSSNGMYYAFLPAVDGTIEVSLKMSSNKATFIYEMTDALWTAIGATANDIAALTTGLGTANPIMADPTFFALPQVFDTYNNSTTTWDGTLPIQATGANVYMVISFPVKANKTYAVGVFGSKLMVRGVNFVTGTSAVKNLATTKATIVKTEYYNILGCRISEPSKKGITIMKNIMSDGSVQTTKGIFIQ